MSINLRKKSFVSFLYQFIIEEPWEISNMFKTAIEDVRSAYSVVMLQFYLKLDQLFWSMATLHLHLHWINAIR